MKNMLIKFKEGLFISAFRENLYRAESNITEFSPPEFSGPVEEGDALGVEVEASTGKGERKFVKKVFCTLAAKEKAPKHLHCPQVLT